MKEQAQALAQARAAYGELSDIYASQKREWEQFAKMLNQRNRKIAELKAAQ